MSSTTVDKKTLNNYITAMRHDVHRSKIHTINSMTRQAKRLRMKKGTEEQKAKNIKKAERIVQEIMVIKELNKDDISKFGLTTTQDLKRLQANIAAPIKIRALARLCIHKFIGDEIRQFKEKYKISEGQILKILRTKKSKRKKTLSVEPKAVDEDLSDFEMKEEEEEEIYKTTDEKSGINDSGNESNENENYSSFESESEKNIISEEEEEMDNISKEESNKQGMFSMNDQSDTEDTHDEEVNEEEASNTHNTKDNADKVNILKKKNNNIGLKKRDRIMDGAKKEVDKLLKNTEALDDSVKNIIKQEDKRDLETFTSEEERNVKSKNKVKATKKVQVKAVDPFFITKENKEYITNQVPVVSNPPEKEVSRFDSFERKGKTFSDGSDIEEKNLSSFQSYTKHQPKRWGQEGTRSSLSDERHMQKYGFFMQANNNIGDGFKNRRERRLNLQKNIDKPKLNEKTIHTFGNGKEEKRPNRTRPQMVNLPSKPEKLHPSWEAKKKLTVIAPFQGKKITFDD